MIPCLPKVTRADWGSGVKVIETGSPRDPEPHPMLVDLQGRVKVKGERVAGTDLGACVTGLTRSNLSISNFPACFKSLKWLPTLTTDIISNPIQRLANVQSVTAIELPKNWHTTIYLARGRQGVHESLWFLSRLLFQLLFFYIFNLC